MHAHKATAAVQPQSGPFGPADTQRILYCGSGRPFGGVCVCACVRACVQASDVVKAAKNDIIASLERLHQGSPLEYP